MASIEYSFVETLTTTSVGDTGILYFQLGATAVDVGTVSVITYMNLVSTQIIGTGGPLFNYILYSSPTDTGTAVPMRCTPASSVTAGTAINIIDRNYPYVVTNPYLGIEINSAAAASFTVYYSMLQFPDSNILNNNFSTYIGTTTSGANTIIQKNSTGTHILKSANVMNLTSGSLAFTYTYASSSITSSTTLAAYTDSEFNGSTYVPDTTGTHNFGVNSDADLNYYFSVTTNQQS